MEGLSEDKASLIPFLPPQFSTYPPFLPFQPRRQRMSALASRQMEQEVMNEDCTGQLAFCRDRPQINPEAWAVTTGNLEP